MTMVRLPFMNLRGSVLYPGMEMTITIGRSETVRAVRRAIADFSGKLVVICQRHVENNGPVLRYDMFDHGCVCFIEKSIFMTDETVKIHLQAESRMRIATAGSADDEVQLVEGELIAGAAEDMEIWGRAAAFAYPKAEFDLTRLLTSLHRNEKTGVDALELKRFNDAVAARQRLLDTYDTGLRRRLLEEITSGSTSPIFPAEFS